MYGLGADEPACTSPPPPPWRRHWQEALVKKLSIYSQTWNQVWEWESERGRDFDRCMQVDRNNSGA